MIDLKHKEACGRNSLDHEADDTVGLARTSVVDSFTLPVDFQGAEE